jgi:hypothetical protein
LVNFAQNDPTVRLSDVSFQSVIDILAYFRDSLAVTSNICYSQSSYDAPFANSKIVDVSTLTSLTTSCRIDRTDDFSG